MPARTGFDDRHFFGSCKERFPRNQFFALRCTHGKYGGPRAKCAKRPVVGGYHCRSWRKVARIGINKEVQPYAETPAGGCIPKAGKEQRRRCAGIHPPSYRIRITCIALQSAAKIQGQRPRMRAEPFSWLISSTGGGVRNGRRVIWRERTRRFL